MNSDSRRVASPGRRRGGRADEAFPRVRLFARNLEGFGSTGELHFLRVLDPVIRRAELSASRSEMPKKRRKKAEAQDGTFDCTLRVMTQSGKIVIEIELDEQARIALAAKLLRQAD